MKVVVIDNSIYDDRGIIIDIESELSIFDIMNDNGGKATIERLVKEESDKYRGAVYKVVLYV